MKLGVLGIGNIGATLGKKWAAVGHDVVFGVRDVASPKAQARRSAGISASSLQPIDRAIAFGDAVLFAVPAVAVEAIVEANGPALDGKIILDATNKFGAAEMNSLAAFTASAPGSRVFRAFNALGWENFAEPQFGALQADLFYCGPDDAQARPAVERLIADIGLRPIYVGGLERVQLVDSLTRLWVALAVEQKMGRRLALKVLTP